MESLIDTNILIRLFVEDDKMKVDEIKALLNSDDKFLIPDIIIAEIIWVLSSFYKQDKTSVIEKISSLVCFKSIISNKDLILNAINKWQYNNISFIDAYLLATTEELNIKTFYTYDKKLSKLSKVKATEP